MSLQSKSASTLRVGLFIGNGTSVPSRGNYSIALESLVQDGSIASWTGLTDNGVAGITTANLDVVLFPGGSGSEEAAAIGTAGAIAVKNFVSLGGGYIVLGASRSRGVSCHTPTFSVVQNTQR